MRKTRCAVRKTRCVEGEGRSGERGPEGASVTDRAGGQRSTALREPGERRKGAGREDAPALGRQGAEEPRKGGAVSDRGVEVASRGRARRDSRLPTRAPGRAPRPTHPRRRTARGEPAAGTPPLHVYNPCVECKGAGTFAAPRGSRSGPKTRGSPSGPPGIQNNGRAAGSGPPGVSRRSGAGQLLNDHWTIGGKRAQGRQTPWPLPPPPLPEAALIPLVISSMTDNLGALSLTSKPERTMTIILEEAGEGKASDCT